MIKVDNCLISEDVIEKSFACNVLACKGVCCIEGDAGAPLEEEEVRVIESQLKHIKEEMDESGLATLADKGCVEKDPFDQMLVTTCKPNKECVFVVRKNGVLNCAIEIANAKKNFDFPKPISCHLYPIRIDKYSEYYALNYHRWSICADACTKGDKEDIRVYQFAKPALERKFGEQWYRDLEKSVREYFKSTHI